MDLLAAMDHYPKKLIQDCQVVLCIHLRLNLVVLSDDAQDIVNAEAHYGEPEVDLAYRLIPALASVQCWKAVHYALRAQVALRGAGYVQEAQLVGPQPKDFGY